MIKEICVICRNNKIFRIYEIKFYVIKTMLKWACKIFNWDKRLVNIYKIFFAQNKKIRKVIQSEYSKYD